MTAKEIRQTLVKQLGNKEDAVNLYKQIQVSLKEQHKPLNSILWLDIIRNDYKEDPTIENKVIHFETNLGWVETVLTNRD